MWKSIASPSDLMRAAGTLWASRKLFSSRLLAN
jgi:hypothetical protein